jgi:prepilin-type N-terminal cleavage/methylation domain-containing protein
LQFIFPRPASAPRGARGFTLLEILLVMALAAVLMFVAMPSFQTLLEGPVNQEAVRLAGVVRMLRNEAVLLKRSFRLVIDLPGGGYSVEQQDRSGQFAVRQDPSLLRTHAFPKTFKLTDVVLFGNVAHPLVDRKVRINLDASGFVDPFLLHFTVDGAEHTYRLSGFKGEVQSVPGYARE